MYLSCVPSFCWSFPLFPSTLCHSYLSLALFLRRHFFITAISMNLNVSLNEMSTFFFLLLLTFLHHLSCYTHGGVKSNGNVNNRNGKINAIQCIPYVQYNVYMTLTKSIACIIFCFFRSLSLLFKKSQSHAKCQTLESKKKICGL